MLPGKNSMVDCIVFLLMGMVLGYGFWGLGGNAKTDLKSDAKLAIEKISAMQGEIGGLKREIEKQRKANYILKTEYNKRVAGLKKKEMADKQKEAALADLSRIHHQKQGEGKLKDNKKSLIDETGKIDESSTIIQEHPLNSSANQDVPSLIGTGWLAGRMLSPDIKILFVDSWPPRKKEYDAGHIPGSSYMGISGLMQAIGNGSTPPDRVRYESMMSGLGINNNDHVVLYGVSGKDDFTLAAFWLMEYFGHAKLSYLNGGLTKWNKEKRPVIKGFSKPVPSSYKGGIPNKSALVKADEILQGLKDPEVVVIDARGSGEYIGKINIEKNRRVGHIPGAIDMDHFTTNFKLDDGTIKFVNDLKAVYESKGVTKDKKIIIYCQAGVRASNTYFILKYVLGYPNVRNYIGSWHEWGNRVDFSKYPVEVSALKDFKFKDVEEAGTKYIGVNKCKACHIKQYNSWKRTKMAVSFENLKPGVKAEEKLKVGLNPKMDFTKDPECLACHTTGYGKPGGFISIEETPEMANVQCEACHGAEAAPSGNMSLCRR